MRSINSLRLKGSQAFCGDPSAKRVSGWTGSQSSAMEHASDEALWPCAAIQTESEVFKLRHSSDSRYPEFRSTTSSSRFLFANEQFLTNLADLNSTTSLTMVKKISPRGQSSGVADFSSSASVASCKLSHQCSNLTCHPRPKYKALLRNSAVINCY